MKLMKSLILFVFVSAIWGLYSKPSPQQYANNPTYYDPAEHLLNRINNAFLSYYGLPADCAKLNNITFSPAQAKLSAPSDSLSMKETSDSLLARWLTIAKECGDDYEFQEGKVEVAVDRYSKQSYYTAEYRQILKFPIAYSDVNKPGLLVRYYAQTATYVLTNNTFDPLPKPDKIISPETAISCHHYAHAKGFPPFKELHKEYLNFADLEPYAEYRSSDGVYLLKFQIVPYGLRGLGIDYLVAGYKYVWLVYSLSTNELLGEVDAVSGREDFYAYGYYYPYDRNAERSYKQSGSEDYANAQQAFSSVGNLSSFACVFIGPLIRNLHVQVTPYQNVSTDKQTEHIETLSQSLAQFLGAYGFSGQVVDNNEKYEYYTEDGYESWSKGLGISYNGFRLYHPLSNISVLWHSYQDGHYLSVDADYLFLPTITLPKQILSPETINKIIRKDEATQRFDYEWVDLTTMDGASNYFPSEENLTDQEIADYEDTNDEEIEVNENSPSSITLILYDDDTDDDLNYILCYWFKEPYHQCIYEAATGRLVEERGELY